MRRKTWVPQKIVKIFLTDAHGQPTSEAIAACLRGMTDSPDFTPTEVLILDVLAARHRTGEPFWTFHTRFRRALNGLKSRGLVNIWSGNVEHTLRVAFTEAGQELLGGSYTSPMEKENAALRIEADELRHVLRYGGHPCPSHGSCTGFGGGCRCV